MLLLYEEGCYYVLLDLRRVDKEPHTPKVMQNKGFFGKGSSGIPPMNLTTENLCSYLSEAKEQRNKGPVHDLSFFGY